MTKLKKLTPTQKLQKMFWTELGARLRERQSFIRPPAPQAASFLIFSIGRTGFGMNALANMRDQWIGVQLYIAKGEKYYEPLKKMANQIEGQLRTDLEWRDMPNHQQCRIRLRHLSLDPNLREDWSKHHEWLIDNLEAFDQTFRPVIRYL